MDLGAVAVLVEVVAAGGFSAAARRLGVTKSAVSKRITGLENQLGVGLIQRNTRPPSLTEAGERFYAYAASAIETLCQAERAATEQQQQPRGHLKVVALMSFGRLQVAPLVSRFLRRYPEIEIDLVLNDHRDVIIGGDFDVAIRAGELTDSALVARRLASLGSVVCAAPSYLKTHGEPRCPNDLKAHNCLVYTYSGEPNRWTFARAGVVESIEVSGTCGVNNGEALCEVVLGGTGISRLPTFIAGPLLGSGQLVSLLRDYTMPSKGLYALFPGRRYIPQKVRVFVDYLVAAFGTVPPVWEATVPDSQDS